MKRYLFSTVCVALLILSLTGWAQADVSGYYQTGGGQDVTIHITVGQSPPMAFIVIQQLPKGVSVLSASPQPSGFKRGGSQVKWLFKHAQPGKMTLSLQLSKPVARNRLQGEIRYRHPGSGAMMSKKIK